MNDPQINLQKTRMPLHVLIVEDSEDDSILLKRALTSNNYDITAKRVEDLNSLEQELKAHHWDIIFSDYSMPGFNAMDALAALKKTGKKIPFILISGSLGEEKAVEIIKAGADDYVMKDRMARLLPAVDRILRDKSIQQSLEEKEEQLRQAQKMEIVGQLAGGIAHDFNNMLAVSMIQCDVLLQRMETADPSRREIEQIKKCSERAAKLTRQLLAFSRKQVLDFRIVDINDTIRSMEKMLSALIGQHIQFSLDLCQDIFPVRVDPIQFEQVFMNLVVNARDAMQNGGTIKVQTKNTHLKDQAQAGEPEQYVEIIVADTGCGMSKEIKARIFEPFFTTKGPQKGTGLGLSTVHGIIHQSKGRIEVESEINRGTTFHIFFPKVELDSEQAALKVETAIPQIAGAGTVLLLEDDSDLRDALHQILKRGGYKVLEADCPNSALDILKSNPNKIHVLLTDVMMPQMSGPGIAKKLLEIQPELSVIFMSGYQDGILDEVENFRIKAHFLQKPFSSNLLLAKMHDAFGMCPAVPKAAIG